VSREPDEEIGFDYWLPRLMGDWALVIGISAACGGAFPEEFRWAIDLGRKAFVHRAIERGILE
jgi:hypothetical protein